MGDTDAETFVNIAGTDYDFDDEAFDDVSQAAKDFISHLLVYRKEERWSAQQCLDSQWLQESSGPEQTPSTNKILSTDKLKKFIIRRKWQVSSPTLSCSLYKCHKLSQSQVGINHVMKKCYENP